MYHPISLVLAAVLALGSLVAVAQADPATAAVPALKPDEGLIFTESVGGRVPLTSQKTGKVVCQLTEGQRVKFIEQDGGVGMGDATAVIEACGTRGTLPNARVITADRLQRSPDGALAVFFAISTCGDGCHSDLWLLGPGSRRILISEDAGAEAKAVWSAGQLRVRVVSAVETDDGVKESSATYSLSLAVLAALKADGSLKITAAPRGVLTISDGGAVVKVGSRRPAR